MHTCMSMTDYSEVLKNELIEWICEYIQCTRLYRLCYAMFLPIHLHFVVVLFDLNISFLFYFSLYYLPASCVYKRPVCVERCYHTFNHRAWTSSLLICVDVPNHTLDVGVFITVVELHHNASTSKARLATSTICNPSGPCAQYPCHFQDMAQMQCTWARWIAPVPCYRQYGAQVGLLPNGPNEIGPTRAIFLPHVGPV